MDSFQEIPEARGFGRQDSERIRILLTSTSYLPALGGAQLHMHTLAKELAKLHSVSVITMWNQNRQDWLLGTTLRAHSEDFQYIYEGVPVRRLGLTLSEKAMLVPWVAIYYGLEGSAISKIGGTLFNRLDAVVEDVDIVNNGRIGRAPLSYASRSLARKRQVPFFLTAYHHPRWHGWFHRHFASLYRRSDGVIALTDVEKRTLIDMGVHESRVFVTGMGPILAPSANADRFRSSLKIDGPLVIFIGQHYEYKGFRQLLEATSLVWAKYPDAHFAFIGPESGNSETHFKNAADSRIHRLGIVDLTTKTDALAACNLLCLPSTQESFGAVLVEAWMFEKPVIGCAIPAVSEVIDHGENGILVKQHPAEIADAICELLGNQVLADRMGRAGRHKVESRYTWKQIGERTHRAYAAVIEGGLE